MLLILAQVTIVLRDVLLGYNPYRLIVAEIINIGNPLGIFL